jgi:hypothetical protein
MRPGKRPRLGTLSLFCFACLFGILSQGGGCERLILIPIYLIFEGVDYDDTVDRDPPPPSPLIDFEARAWNRAVYLTWNFPPGGYAWRVHIRRGETGFPPSINDGTEVHNGPGFACVDPGLEPGVTYYYSAWNYNSDLVYSAVAEVTGTPTSIGNRGWIGGGSDGWQTGTAPGAGGSGDREFSGPQGLAVDENGNLYVADTGNHRICKWDAEGNAQGWIGGGVDGWQTGGASSAGTDQRSFTNPADVAVDSAGNIFVADTGNHRICKWSPGGDSLGWIGDGATGWQSGEAPLATTSYAGFDSPQGLGLEEDGDIYVADTGNHRICRWWPTGDPRGFFGGGLQGWRSYDSTEFTPAAGSDDAYFDTPTDVALSRTRIFIADAGNHRICRRDFGGYCLGWIGGGATGWNTTGGVSTAGGDLHSFQNPRRVAIDVGGQIFVSDTGNNRICTWTPDGGAVGWIGGGLADMSDDPVPPAFGADARSFDAPQGLDLSIDHDLFVADTNNGRVSAWQD